MALHTWTEGENIYAEYLNGNNEYILDTLNSKTSALESTLETNVSSLTEKIDTNTASIETLEAEIDELSEADVFSKISPNYSGGYGISSGWTATAYGWLSCECHSSANYVGYVNVNGVMVARDYQISGDSRAGTHYSLSMAFVSKGDVVTFANSTVKFYPCKGA